MGWKAGTKGVKMRFLLAVTVVLVGISVSGTAEQHPKQFKAKGSNGAAEAAPKSTATVKASSGANSAGTSKELQNLERKTAKSAGPSHAKATRTPAMKPEKSTKNPPINFGGKGGAGVGTSKQAANPYKGRLKQKGQGRR
jgi:hypothetical protein